MDRRVCRKVAKTGNDKVVLPSYPETEEGLSLDHEGKLRLSGIHDIDGDTINALAKHCMNLIDIGFVDCCYVDEAALGNVLTLRFPSVAGTTRMNWALVSQYWTKLPNLKGLDISSTNITRSVVWMLLSSSTSLKVLCALHCPALEEGDRGSTNYYPRGKLVIAFFPDMFKELSSLLGDFTKKESNVFSDWRNMKKEDKNLEEIMTWVEWILSYSLLWIADGSIEGLDDFWLSQGVALALNLMQSSQEDVQEKATMAITNLSVNDDAAKAVVEEGGIKILSILAMSMSRSVAGKAAGGLWNLSVTEEHKEHAAGALANMAADDKLSMVVAKVGGLRALVMLAQNCKLLMPWLIWWPIVDDNSVKVGQEAGALEALVELTLFRP
ncbi:hypothetical protein RHMOL_Rhmol07G0042100 [Rhododendron molle]|uniref:Uncharacterized protein n=3 Tax=Rhododendron molle TaxID=49168 RepID=A0ACC0MYV3_RHOML|nr:hypothetical protein RHMOL_Rhmol07G0042100 [Rhododendron molle]KAI8545466.1 hypothetical protein RHMOL_Rhmol07G0042100 [Rhododendron molle]KAI8545468.1 hypothetical protein RHMOL_Rhmol07G0042100 [Rhododendron molle]